jgi:transcriptional regulator
MAKFEQTSKIDRLLAELDEALPQGMTLTQSAIAGFCECTRQNILYIEKKALKQLARSKLKHWAEE